jgi:hypothetical protein
MRSLCFVSGIRQDFGGGDSGRGLAAAAQARLEQLGTAADPGPAVKTESLVEPHHAGGAFIALVAP